jgi:hypothetical protein
MLQCNINKRLTYIYTVRLLVTDVTANNYTSSCNCPAIPSGGMGNRDRLAGQRSRGGRVTTRTTTRAAGSGGVASGFYGAGGTLCGRG